MFDLLKGIRVLDFTQILSGPFATMLLSDAGADVVKVERPKLGDPTRQWGPPFVNEESVYFAAFNRGKRSVALDLQCTDDLEKAKQLAASADVVVENIRAGSLEERGLGYEDLRSLNSKIIYVSIRGYSEFSPRSRDAGLEVILEAESGLMSITGPGENGYPVRLGVAAIDMMTGLSAVSCIYSALYKRERTGEGAYVSVSLEEIAALMMTHPWLMYLKGGMEYQALGSAHPSIAPYETFQTAEKRIMIGAVDNVQFARLTRVLDTAEWLKEPKWSTNSSRVENREELHRIVEERLLTDTADHWKERLAEANLPVAVVETVSSAAERWMSTGVPRLSADHPVMGELTWPTSPWRQAGGAVAPPPTLGDSTEQVFTEWIGHPRIK